MLKKLMNECKVEFQLVAKSPLSIRSGEKLDLDPTLPDNQFIRSQYMGEESVVMPGSSIKGVFRNRVEQLIGNTCNVLNNSGCHKANDMRLGIEEKYIKNCPACRIFGSLSLKSRINFKDAFPDKENPIKLSRRNNVGIDRVTGAAKKGALFEPEILEEGTFNVEIILKNFFLWQLKYIMMVLDDIDEGYVTFGGVTSRGFGQMAVENVVIKMRDYSQPNDFDFYTSKSYTREEIMEKLKTTSLNDGEYRKVDFNEQIL